MNGKILLFITIIILTGTLHAQPYKIGLGIKFGEPAGLDGKFFLSKGIAIEGILGFSGPLYGSYRYKDELGVIKYYRGSRLTVGMSYLIHKYNLFEGADNLVVYYGAGGLLGATDFFSAAVVGVIGLELYFVSVPFSFSLDLMPGIQMPYFGTYFGGGLGIRFLLSQ